MARSRQMVGKIQRAKSAMNVHAGLMRLDRLTAELADYLYAQTKKPLLCGISGGQGAGKSTLCAALVEDLAARRINCLTLALDDFYLPRAARAELAETVHPNCMTRGVPGTHDIALLTATLDALMTAGADDTTPLPVFSKSHDDRLPEAEWHNHMGRPDIILLEGWCVGGYAEFLNGLTPTAWERRTDPDNIWKNWSRRQAAQYEPIWNKCDTTLLLRQESFDAVIDSRWLQEQGNAAASGVWQFKSREETAAFCAHYESWTLAIWQHLPPQAAFTIIRDADFNYRLAAD